jgi:hypothetical protein
MASSDAGANPMMVVMGLGFFALAYVNFRWAGIFIADPRKARRRGWPVAVVGGLAGAFFVVGGLSTFL